MADRIITVTKGADGKLEYAASSGVVSAANPFQVQVDPLDKVVWTSPDGHISIVFKGGRSPFTGKRRTVAADEDDFTDSHTVRKLKPVERPKAKFSFAVMHMDDKDKIVVDDPDLIVDDPGGGGGPR